MYTPPDGEKYFLIFCTSLRNSLFSELLIFDLSIALICSNRPIITSELITTTLSLVAIEVGSDIVAAPNWLGTTAIISKAVAKL